jgi:hypothetical protein
MRSFVKRNVAAIAAGAVVIVGGSYVGAKALTAPQQVTLESASSSPAPASGTQERGLVRGEGVFARKNGTVTAQVNRGFLSSVDGTTLVISEADGTTQRVGTTSDTRFRRDGQKASISDLKPGDHIATLAVKQGDSFTTKFVRAYSPDEWNARQQKRMQRKGTANL